MKILFCTDGSKISYCALHNFSHWVRNAVVDTICVIDWSFLPDEINLDAQNFTASCANVADTVLNYAQESVSEYGLTNGKRIKGCGSVVESILEQLEAEKYDLILMGSNGKKGLQKWLGSVSQEIINSSKISDYISKHRNNRKRVLFTTDGTPCSDNITESILPNINFEDKEVYICMVNEDPKFLFLDGNMDTNWISDIQREQQVYAKNAINRIKVILDKHNIKVKSSVILSGNASQEIIKFAREHEIDLIILGSRNKSRTDRLLTGSESRRILENTSSDIWLIRCAQVSETVNRKQ